jgi:hypothetical protein
MFRQDEFDKEQVRVRAETAEQVAQAEISKNLYNEALAQARLVDSENILLKQECSRLTALGDTLR